MVESAGLGRVEKVCADDGEAKALVENETIVTAVTILFCGDEANKEHGSLPRVAERYRVSRRWCTTNLILPSQIGWVAQPRPISTLTATDSIPHVRRTTEWRTLCRDSEDRWDRHTGLD